MQKVLGATKLAYVSKIKETIVSWKLDSRDFWQIANSVFSKCKCAITPLFNVPEVLCFVSYKAKLIRRNFSKNSNHDD